MEYWLFDYLESCYWGEPTDGHDIKGYLAPERILDQCTNYCRTYRDVTLVKPSDFDDEFPYLLQ